MEAKITLEYDKTRIAEAVATAIAPENFKTPKGLVVKTVQSQNQVVTNMTIKGRLATLIATIDDLLFSASIAERTIGIVKGQEKDLQKKPEKTN